MTNLLLFLNFVFCFFISNATAGIQRSAEFQSFAEIKASFLPSDRMVVDRFGKNLEPLRIDDSERSLPWVGLNEVSYAFKTMLLKSEDRRFFEHDGVDWRSLFKASWQHFTSGTQRGASTISMQLVGLLDADVKRHRKTVWDKWDQIQKALYLEKHWSKDEILEAYINLVPFRGELVGLTSASFGYFQKAPTALTNEESALLASLLRSPNAGSELVAKRACLLLERDNCHLLLRKSNNLFVRSYEIKRPRLWLSVVDESFLKKNAKAKIIETTLDKRIQVKAVQSLQEQIRLFKNQNLNDGAILVLDNRTGDVLAYVGNAGVGFSSSPQVDGIRAERQAGSTLKPFVYATAIDMNLIHHDSLIDDSPLDILVGKGSIYYPRNYDNSFKGMVSAGEALGSSLNVPAVKTLQLIGGDTVVEKMHKLGFKNLREAAFYGPSLALGSVDVSLWDLTHAYQKLAASKIFKKKTREEIFQMLSSDENRRHTFGTGSILSLPFSAAVKTGTSKDMRDNWCVGFSDRYTVGVWVGNFNGKAMWNVSGVTGAAPLWRAVMLELHRGKNEVRVLDQTLAQAIPEVLPAKKNITYIRYPVNEEVVGIDPEIPARLQKMPLEIAGMKPGYKLMMDDKFLTDTMWSVVNGKHQLKLFSAENNLIDEVSFEVR
jgi:penicillin-binding protein 1C